MKGSIESLGGDSQRDDERMDIVAGLWGLHLSEVVARDLGDGSFVLVLDFRAEIFRAND